jgi:septum site-determining protein MinC
MLGLRESRLVVHGTARSRHSFRFRGRSFMAFVLAPEPPVGEWIAELDRQIGRSEGFFIGRPVVIDLAALQPTRQELAHLIRELQARDIRIMGVENVDPAALGEGLPPLLKGGRAVPRVLDDSEPSPGKAPAAVAGQAQPAGLVLDQPVRSGQSVVFTGGDVTVIGSVASGAEIIAAGSVHVYGTLRGRVMAGSTGNARARIFCRKIEAELVAIDGFYRTAEDIEPNLRQRAVQVWLEGDVMRIAALD